MLSSILLGCLFLASALGDLRSDLNQAGVSAVLPGDSGYDGAAKPYNTRFNQIQPAAIGFPKSAEDVSKLVTIGSKNNLPVSARSGGHSYVANGLGGRSGTLVIDMSNMKKITVDGSTHIATIETGNRLGNVALGLNDAGRALPHGTCLYVGIGGHMAYGGFGVTSRMWGLTLDTVQAVNAVLPNGTIIRATSNTYSDLFWAFRGAAPSFGIITSVETTTFSTPSSSLIFSHEWFNLQTNTAATALLNLQSYAQNQGLPSEFGVEIVIGKADSQGRLYFSLSGGYYGSNGQSGLGQILDPLLQALQLPASDSGLNIKSNGSYIDSVRALAVDDGGLDTNGSDTTDNFYAKSIMIPEGAPLSSQACESFMKYLGDVGQGSSLDWFTEIELFGGKNSKINSVAVDSTAFGRRDSLLTMQLYASAGKASSFPQDAFTFLDGLVQTMTSAMPSDWNYGAYANYIDERQDNWQQRYFGTHYQRLQTLKTQVDPRNTLVFPQSVEPGSGSGSGSANGQSSQDPPRMDNGARALLWKRY
ncbi:glucooligosaccharide oxidase [Moniliophthora roreri]|nr:glucooligosaccharide oxidase [Moniliophthora roreri]